MKPHFIKSSQKKEILKELSEIYGITNLPYLLLETGKKKIRAFSGSLSKEEISQLDSVANIEIIGMYLISKKDESARLNFDALTLKEIKNQITNSILEINDEQLQLWLRGYDLEVPSSQGIIVLKYKEDLVGIGKSNGQKIFNYLPKERKLKTPLPKHSLNP